MIEKTLQEIKREIVNLSFYYFRKNGVSLIARENYPGNKTMRSELSYDPHYILEAVV